MSTDNNFYLPLSVLHRYIQLLIFTITQPSTYDMASLRRDSALLRFLHSFLTSAPLAILQLYILIMVVQSEQLYALKTLPHLVVAASLGASIVSLLLTLLCYIGSDRLHSNLRRVVLPAYVTTFFWHFFIIPSRIGSLALFSVAHGPYVAVVIGVHWIIAAVWTLCERTNLCGDDTKTPKKRRLHLEIPFVIVISFIFTFIYFKLREGSTLTRIVAYHLLTSVETIIISSLFYINMPSLSFAPWAFSFVVGSYILGMSFMALYYAAWHPKRTTNCFTLGIPYACDCCEAFHKSSDTIGNVDLPLESLRQQSTTPSSNGNGVVPISELELITAVPSSIADGKAGHNRPTQSTPLGRRYLIGGGVGEESKNMRLREQRATTLNAPPLRHSSGSQYTHYSHLDPPPVGQQRSTSPSRRSLPPLPPGRRHTWFARSSSEHHSSYNADVHSTPQEASRNANWRRSDGNINDDIVPTAHLAYFGINNQMYNLPSPIGEEPATPTGILGGNRKFSAPVVQVNGINQDRTKEPMRSASVGGFVALGPPPLPGRGFYTPTGSRRSSNSTDGRIQLEPPPYTTQSRSSSFSRNQPERHSGRLYAEIRDCVPPPHARQGSISPSRPGSERSSRHSSPGARVRSVNCSPKHSPYSSQRRSRHPSNPLHTHDPMQEFTKLYSTPSHGNYGILRKPPRASSSPTGDDTEGSQRAASTSSSHLVSSDNYSDAYIIDDQSSESGRLTRKSSQRSCSDTPSIPISACSGLLSTSTSVSKNPQPHLTSGDHMTSRTDRMTSRTDHMTCQSDLLFRPALTSHTFDGTLV